LKEPPVAGIDLPLISLAGVPKQKGRERWGIQPWIMLSFLALEVISPPPPPPPPFFFFFFHPSLRLPDDWGDCFFSFHYYYSLKK